MWFRLALVATCLLAAHRCVASGDRFGQLLDRAEKEDERVAELLRSPDAAPDSPPPWCMDETLPGKMAAAVRLQTAWGLVAARRYEAALAWLEGFQAADAPTPALLHYCNGVSRFMLLDLEAAKPSLESLLQLGDQAAPRQRYVAEAILRKYESLKPGEPAYIAMQMSDVERRLELGRSEKKDLDEQHRVVDALDKLIKEMEKKQREQSSSSGSGSASGQSPSSSPMEESQPGDMKAAGEVPTRLVEGPTDWGALPPAERSRVLQQIQRDFPPHYRAVVEEYFKNLSSGESFGEAAP